MNDIGPYLLGLAFVYMLIKYPQWMFAYLIAGLVLWLVWWVVTKLPEKLQKTKVWRALKQATHVYFHPNREG